MNWGWKIVMVYSAFVIMTLAMVFYFMSQKVDLVAEDYYKQEIAYQDQIDKMENTKALKEPIGFAYSVSNRLITLDFPESHVTQGIEGIIHLYRPANSEEDKEFIIQPEDSGLQTIAVGSLSKGLWRIKISWSSAGSEFYDEKTVTL